jgi:hypothetical protein
MVTPFAFNIAPSVLYTPLASPLKRGIAIAIDGLLISVLAEQAGWLFILFVGLTLLIERRSHQIGKAFKWALYLSLLLMTIWVTSDNIVELNRGAHESDAITEDAREPSVLASLAILPEIMAFTLCETRACADSKFVGLVAKVEAMPTSHQEKRQMLLQLIAELELPDEDLRALSQTVAEQFPETLEADPASSATMLDNQQRDGAEHLRQPDEVKVNDPKTLAVDPEITEENDIHISTISDNEVLEDDKEAYSLLGWTKGILNDLGLGFGWAAFYFTVFTAWFDGQTLGKKLVNIRVIQLDGSAISLWDAFGRYGGYGAGFATGLLGFLQIYWDANRQAIQDKISATVVIDLSKSKQIPIPQHMPVQESVP